MRQQLTIKTGASASLLSDDPVLARASAAGLSIDVQPEAPEALGAGRFAQEFRVSIDGAAYKMLRIEWTECAPWWRRWRLRVWREIRREMQ